jgi:hypothetical protein
MPPMFPSRPHPCNFLGKNPKPNTHLDLYTRPLDLNHYRKPRPFAKMHKP